ncbi:MAG: dihydroxy-acid dehydratase, partial [Armatimonadota bacterium]|nr:dihydroxy-acid dehydratase [Armatimonadota bacterium]
MCDGTAQSTVGMAYSLQSRNLAAEAIVNQMESQQYHGALVLQGCDKTPFAAVCALSLLDRVRQARGDLHVFASFVPAHVLRGGTIPPTVRTELEALAARAEAAGHCTIAEDLREALTYLLQCTSTQAFQGVLARAVQQELLAPTAWRRIERALAAHTCHPDGGICAFNGTGNSSRLAVAALGLVHPAVELLTEPPDQTPVNAAVDALFAIAPNPHFSASRLVESNFANAVRVHSATGGSTNLMIHLVAARVYAGRTTTVADVDAIRRAVPIPDLFDYSLTEGRDHFTLAQHVAAGRTRGVESLFAALVRNGVPMDLDAPTAAGGTWHDRLGEETGAEGNGEEADPRRGRAIILSRPRRPVSGVEVLAGNFLQTAVVKISGIPDQQLDEFDEKIALVLYFDSEEAANAGLLDVRLLQQLEEHPHVSVELLRRMVQHNGGVAAEAL